MPLITIEQAVEAVEKCTLWLVSGGVELSVGMAGPVDIRASVAETKKQLIAALRAIQPQEASANPDADLQRARQRAHDAEAALGRLREALSSAEQAVRDVTREAEVACCPVDKQEPSEAEVERVARAVWSLFSKGTPTNEDIARAAIAAMREKR